MRYIVSLFASLLYLPSALSAEPTVKIINFTADWCPNCQILNPRLDEAISGFATGSVARVDLDTTGAGRSASPLERAAVRTEALEQAAHHQVAYLWNQYGGITGLAVAVSSDTGERLACFMRPMTTDDIEARLRLSLQLAEHGKPGQRSALDQHCPEPPRG
ncbi:MAG: thioredoxin family protein [Pseudomonadota bacterium]